MRASVKISSSSVAKLLKGENVNADILVKICIALECDVPDIMEITQDDESED
jgi:putative transcriptional regulator